MGLKSGLEKYDYWTSDISVADLIPLLLVGRLIDVELSTNFCTNSRSSYVGLLLHVMTSKCGICSHLKGCAESQPGTDLGFMYVACFLRRSMVLYLGPDSSRVEEASLWK